MVWVIELNGSGDDLFEALGFGRVGSELIDDIVEYFGALIDKIGLDLFVEGFSGANNKALLVDFEILG